MAFIGSSWGPEDPVSDGAYSLAHNRGNSFLLAASSMIFIDECQIYLSNTDFYSNSYLRGLTSWTFIMSCPSALTQ